MALFIIRFDGDAECVTSFDEAHEIALDWSIEEGGKVIEVEDCETGKITGVWA